MMHHDAIHVPCMLHHPAPSCTILYAVVFSELTDADSISGLKFLNSEEDGGCLPAAS
jgi:hypothetical protein